MFKIIYLKVLYRSKSVMKSGSILKPRYIGSTVYIAGHLLHITRVYASQVQRCFCCLKCLDEHIFPYSLLHVAYMCTCTDNLETHGIVII